MKNKILNNFGYKILSVFLAIILWIVVMNISDYSITKEIDNIDVIQLNGDVLEELDKIYDVASGDTVDIIIKGRRSVVSNLSASDFTATADLSTMSITNTVQIVVTPKDKSIADDITIIYVDNTMKLNLEEKVSEQFPVKIKTTGTPHEGYAVGETSATPNIITIEGPKSTIEKITEVVATVSVDNVQSNFEKNCEIVLYDAYGEQIKNDKIILSCNEVEVNVNVYPVKNVAVNVEVKGTPEDGYEIAEVIYQPQTVTIAGPVDEINGIENIAVNDIFVSGMSEDLQTTVNINEYLPKGVFVADTNSEVVITVDIEQVEEKVFTPTNKHFTLKNKQSGCSYNVILSNDFKLVVSGLKNDIEDITLTDIDLEIDCSQLSVGMNNNVDIIFEEKEGLAYKIQGSVIVEVTD